MARVRMIELPLEKIADFVAALRNEVWNCPEHERRALPRIRVWAPRTIRITGDAGAPATPRQSSLDVWVVDLACGGVGFLSPRPLDVGTEFTLALPSMEATPSTVTCRVLHCQPAANGSFNVGARFVKEEPAEAPGPAAQAAA